MDERMATADYPRSARSEIAEAQIWEMGGLTFFNCVVRPVDFSGDGLNRIKFKQFGWLIAAVPASVYASANVVMATHFTAESPMPADDNAITHLLTHLARISHTNRVHRGSE
jgi:hypothetical protein